MFSIIKRILRLSGKYRPRVIAGLIFNALKSCCAAFVFFAVLLVMLNIEHLTETVILQAFGIVALSVLGRFLFQYLSDVLMSASGYEIFREKRLEIGNQLKRVNSTPFVRQYDIMFNRWGDLLCQEENQTNDTRQNLRSWSWKP